MGTKAKFRNIEQIISGETRLEKDFSLSESVITKTSPTSKTNHRPRCRQRGHAYCKDGHSIFLPCGFSLSFEYLSLGEEEGEPFRLRRSVNTYYINSQKSLLPVSLSPRLFFPSVEGAIELCWSLELQLSISDSYSPRLCNASRICPVPSISCLTAISCRIFQKSCATSRFCLSRLFVFCSSVFSGLGYPSGDQQDQRDSSLGFRIAVANNTVDHHSLCSLS